VLLNLFEELKTLTIQRFTKLIEQQAFMLDVLLASASLGPIWAGRVRVPFEDRTLSVVSRDGLRHSRSDSRPGVAVRHVPAARACGSDRRDAIDRPPTTLIRRANPITAWSCAPGSARLPADGGSILAGGAGGQFSAGFSR
jgi:hypothetical protein